MITRGMLERVGISQQVPGRTSTAAFVAFDALQPGGIRKVDFLKKSLNLNFASQVMIYRRRR